MDFQGHGIPIGERLMRYCRINTQSDPHSPTTPSTPGQRDLARLLVEELRELGVNDALVDDFGYVYATVPGNSQNKVPVLCFCAHMDTSPDCSGQGVMPLIHRNYDGKDLVLSADPSQVIRLEDHPDLKGQIGHDIITADGTTLLGADNKAGIAAIMEAVSYWISHPQTLHGTIRILFTVDEEIGRGADHVDLEKLGARYAYTVDGETLGSLEDENFNADRVEVEIKGIATHTGYAKDKLVNSLKVASRFLDSLPRKELSPESTEGKEGFVHPLRMEGTMERSLLEFLIRDFEESGLAEKEAWLRQQLDDAVACFPGVKSEFRVIPQYRNMKKILDRQPKVVDYALEAIAQAGLLPFRKYVRGGTDGSRLSYMGLPCPNIFAGEHDFHSRKEWVSVQDMEKSMEVLVRLAALWEQKSQGYKDSAPGTP